MESIVKKILTRGVEEDFANMLLEQHHDKFVAAFTTKIVDEYKNYEYFEQIGDLSLNKIIVNYMGKRFPQLRNSEGTGVLAILRIVYGSKDFLSILSNKCEFDKIVICAPEEKLDKKRYKDILEDVFESFIGVVEYSIDSQYNNVGVGYNVVYRIMSSLLDEEPVSIEYENLVDAKTRLFELKDESKINIRYAEERINNIYISKLYYNNIQIGEGTSAFKKTSQILAAEEGLKWLKENRNLVKTVPDRFKTFSKFNW